MLFCCPVWPFILVKQKNLEILRRVYNSGGFFNFFVQQSKNIYHSKNGQATLSSSMGSTLPTSLRSVCSILHYLSVCITAVSAGGERLGESFLRKTKVGGAVHSKSDIYSLTAVHAILSFLFLLSLLLFLRLSLDSAFYYLDK